jgi:tRNA G10  N-methylase Trm11
MPTGFVVVSRERGNELVAAECFALTGAHPRPDGLALCDEILGVERSAYLRLGGHVLARASSLDALIAEIRRMGFRFDAFRIEHVGLDGAPSGSSRERTIAVAEALTDSYPNLNDPKTRLAVVVSANAFLFGEIRVEPDRSYEQHDAKPYTTSSSLPSRLSRALVNLVAKPGAVVLDPCCGVGSLLLEVVAVGATAVGCDWNVRMVGMSRANLAHFGYEGTVHRADARTWTTPVDAVVTDLPYGRNTVAPEEVVRGILAAVARVAPRAVFVAFSDIRPWMENAGFRDVNVYDVPKHTGFVRRVHVGESAVFTRR